MLLWQLHRNFIKFYRAAFSQKTITMKKILLLVALCTLMCIGCKNEVYSKEPPLGNTYLDLENLWTVYAKNIDTVKNLFKGNFISEKDSIRDRLGVKIMYKVLTYKNNTPAGNFTIQCIFYKDILIEIYADSEWFNTSIQALPHYKTMSDEANLLAQSTFFEFGCNYYSHVSPMNSPLPDLTFNFENARNNYFTYINDYIPKFTPNTNNEFFYCYENWQLRVHDIAGYPGPPPVDMLESMYLHLYIVPNGRAKMVFSISSKLNQIVD